MASTFSQTLALSLVLNLLFFSLVTACGECGGGSPYPKPRPKPKPKPTPRPTPGSGRGSGSTPSTGGGGGTPVIGGGGIPIIGGGGTPVIGGGGIPVIGGGGTPVVGGGGRCPVDALKLGVCANVLNGLLNVTVGNPPRPNPATPCCPLIKGLIDAEAAICLCTAIRANVLGINLNIPVALSLLVNFCGCQLPRGFQCP